MVVVAMVVPALGLQFLHEVLDHYLPQFLMGSDVQGFDVRQMTS
jgi:hypothetical protein